jgi:hypothetical protein
MGLRRITKSTTIFSLPILFLLNISATSKNAFWEIKDYRHWSAQECEKMLTDSPWAKGYYYGYTAQLFSALPIRQAIVRQRQIAENYESLSPEKRQEFDKRAGEYLAEAFPDWIVVRVVLGGRDPYTGKTYSNRCPYWQMRTTDMLKGTVFLTPSGKDRIPLEQFIAPQPAVCEFQFIFHRQYKGRPVLSKRDKSLLLEFTVPVTQSASSAGAPSAMQDVERRLIEFKVSKMKFNGELVY